MKMVGSRFHAIVCALVLAALLALPAPAAAFPPHNYGIKSEACSNVETDLPVCQDGGAGPVQTGCVGVEPGPPPGVVIQCTFVVDAPFGSTNSSAAAGEEGAWRMHAELAINETTPLFDGLHIAMRADGENGSSVEHDNPLSPPSIPEPRWRTPTIQAFDT